jgi:hypothetical protein
MNLAEHCMNEEQKRRGHPGGHVVRSWSWDGAQAKLRPRPAGEARRERWPKESPFFLFLASLAREKWLSPLDHQPLVSLSFTCALVWRPLTLVGRLRMI